MIENKSLILGRIVQALAPGLPLTKTDIYKILRDNVAKENVSVLLMGLEKEGILSSKLTSVGRHQKVRQYTLVDNKLLLATIEEAIIQRDLEEKEELKTFLLFNPFL